MEDRIITQNRSAYHDYVVLEKYEAGIVLEGSEVKSCRANQVNLKDGFCLIVGHDVIMKNVHIALYDKAGAFNTKNSKRDRKLLLHKNEAIRIHGNLTQKGLTLIPLKMYFKGSLIKVELGLCKGKHLFDKKKSLMEKDIARETQRDIKNYGLR